MRFENDKDNLFYMIKNDELYASLMKKISKNKYFKKKLIKNKSFYEDILNKKNMI